MQGACRTRIPPIGLGEGNMSYHAIRVPDDTVVQPMAPEWPTLRE